MEILYFVQTFFATPAILIGLFGMVGSILQKKKASQVLTSTFKTITGYLVLGGGAGVLVGSLAHFNTVFEAVFGVSGIIPNNDALGAIYAKLPQIGTLAALIMIIGMLGNILLAAVTKWKYIYLSGHVLFYMSCMIAVALSSIGMDPAWSADAWMILIVGGMFMSMYLIISPAITQRFMKSITKSDTIAMAHTSGISYAIAGWIGEGLLKASKKEKLKSTEEINFPKGLAFLRNSNVSVVLTMLILFVVLYVSAWIKIGKTGLIEIGYVGEDGSVLVQIIIDAFTFAAGIEIILFGVRTVLAELVPAFKGVSEKLVKGAKPALDCPIVFPYAPNAVFIGFLTSLSAGVIMMGVTIGLSKIDATLFAIIIPGVTAHFFTGATAGVFGNAKGGVWGSVLGGFVNGIIITLVPIAFWALSLVDQSEPLVWGDADYAFGLILGIFMFIKLSWTKYLVLVTFIILFVFMMTFGAILQAKVKKTNSNGDEDSTIVENKKVEEQVKVQEIKKDNKVDVKAEK